MALLGHQRKPRTISPPRSIRNQISSDAGMLPTVVDSLTATTAMKTSDFKSPQPPLAKQSTLQSVSLCEQHRHSQRAAVMHAFLNISFQAAWEHMSRNVERRSFATKCGAVSQTQNVCNIAAAPAMQEENPTAARHLIVKTT